MLPTTWNELHSSLSAWKCAWVSAAGRFFRSRWKKPLAQPKFWWYGQWNQKTINWWWGEGDEKFYVDGERFPSTFGTGSEDYVGYAWSAEAPFPMFESPFASQPHVPIEISCGAFDSPLQ